MTLKIIALCFVCLAVMSVGSARAANPVVVMDTSMGTIRSNSTRTRLRSR